MIQDPQHSNLRPILNIGEFIFCTLNDLSEIDQNNIISFFKEAEGYSLILTKEFADSKDIHYETVMGWITLADRASIKTIQLTAEYATALKDNHVGCCVVPSFYHDHIFVDKLDEEKAMTISRPSTKHVRNVLTARRLDLQQLLEIYGV